MPLRILNPNGISVIICCHNSAEKLPLTLKYLLAQRATADLRWEVIVVDNNSSDATAQVALKAWDRVAIPLRVLYEPHLGLSHARKLGYEEARFEIVSFVDDDNWVPEDWIEKAFQIMAVHPEVAACGGKTIPVFESDPPSWFDRFQCRFAVGEQSEGAGIIREPYYVLWGAGLTVRKSAVMPLYSHEFNLMLTGRTGNQLAAGEDSELCYALKLLGWKIWYDPQLTLQHFMPKNRLTWSNLCKMSRGFGQSHITLNFYRWALRGVPKYQQTWIYRLFYFILKIILNPRPFIKALQMKGEGDYEVLLMEERIGGLVELLRLRTNYNVRMKTVNRLSDAVAGYLAVE